MMAAAVIEPDEPQPQTATDPEHWALAYTHPREEFRARASLEAAGFDVYLPTTYAWKRPRYSTRRVLMEVPRFDRYIFVGMELDPKKMRWSKIRVTPGIASIVANSAGVPAIVPLKLVDLIRAQVAAEPKPEARAKKPEWKPGELLAVISGIYIQCRAKFDGWEGEQCRVFIHTFGRDTKTRIDPKHLSSL